MKIGKNVTVIAIRKNGRFHRSVDSNVGKCYKRNRITKYIGDCADTSRISRSKSPKFNIPTINNGMYQDREYKFRIW